MQSTTAKLGNHSWRDVVRILKRHFRASAAFFIVVCLLVVCVIFFAPRKYRSTAKYLIRFGHEAAAIDTVGASAEVHRTSDSIVKSVQEIIQSEVVADRVVKQLGAKTILNGDPAEPTSGGASKGPSLLKSLLGWLSNIDPISEEERAIIFLHQGLKVSTPSTSNVVVATYSASSPAQAFKVMETFSKVFLEEHSRIHQTVGSYEFLLDQNKILAKQVDATLEKLNSAKNRYGMGSVEGKRANVERRIDEVEAALLVNARSTVSSQIRAQQLDSILKNLPEFVRLNATSGVDDQSSAGMRQKLYELEIREKELLSKYSPDHPNVKAIQSQLQEAKLILATIRNSRTETSEGINPVHQSFSVQLMGEQANLAALAAETKELKSQLTELKTQLVAINNQEVEITQLATEASVAKSKLESHAVQLERARMELELSRDQITSIGVIETPRIHERPSSPNKKLVALLGLIFAIGGAVCFPFVIEYLKDEQGAQEVTREQKNSRRGRPTELDEQDDDLIDPSFLERERVAN